MTEVASRPTESPISPDGIRQLYAYHWWANHRTVDTASRLASADLDRDLQVGHRSVHGTLVHLLSADWIWLERWHGRSPPAMLTPREFPTLARLVARWTEVERAQDGFVAGLTAARLADEVAYVNTQGERWQYPLWRQLVHVVNHGSYHRGQIAAFARQLGAEPLATDLLVYDDVTDATG